jgi:hypothetical protein
MAYSGKSRLRGAAEPLSDWSRCWAERFYNGTSFSPQKTPGSGFFKPFWQRFPDVEPQLHSGAIFGEKPLRKYHRQPAEILRTSAPKNDTISLAKHLCIELNFSGEASWRRQPFTRSPFQPTLISGWLLNIIA